MFFGTTFALLTNTFAPKTSSLPLIVLVYCVMYNMAALNVQCEAATEPQHLCFPRLLFLSVPAFFVIVDIVVKLGNTHERQTCLFLILWLILRG